MRRQILSLVFMTLSGAVWAGTGISDKKAELVQAAKDGNLATVQVLLARGTNPNTADADGISVLMWAANSGHTSVVKLLLDEGAEADMRKSDTGITALWQAAVQGHAEVVKLLLDAGAEVNIRKVDNGVTALWMAAQNGHTEVVTLLIDKDAAIEVKNKAEGLTALWMAAQNGHADIVKLLLARGAAANVSRTTDGATALMAASRNGFPEVVRLLLARDADVDAKTTDDATALYAAAQEGHLEIVKLLLSYGADVNAKSSKGQTALYMAAQNGHLPTVRLLLEHGANVNARSGKGATALYLAVQNGHLEVAEALLEAGADINAKSNGSATALLIATQARQLEMVKLLLEHKADVNAQHASGATPLWMAAQIGHLEIAAALLEAGADVNAKAHAAGKDYTPLSVAEKMGHNGMVELLNQHVAKQGRPAVSPPPRPGPSDPASGDNAQPAWVQYSPLKGPKANEYRAAVKFLAEEELYKDRSEAEVYADVVKKRTHSAYVAFLELFPHSIQARRMQTALEGFHVLEITGAKPMRISYGDLRAKFGYDGSAEYDGPSGAPLWGSGFTIDRFEMDSGVRVLEGKSFFFGNLEVLSGTLASNGQTLLIKPGATIVYPARALAILPPLTGQYRAMVKSFSATRLYSGKSEEEVYRDVLEQHMHYRYVAFLEMFPDSNSVPEMWQALRRFRLLKAPADRPMMVSESALEREYGFNGLEGVYYWGQGLGFMRIGEAGRRIWQGAICAGNLQFLSGGFVPGADGWELLPGTQLIYPAQHTEAQWTESHTAETQATEAPPSDSEADTLVVALRDPEPPELHDATRRILARLHQPITMKLYYTSNVGALSGNLYAFHDYFESVHRLLEEYVHASHGMVELFVIDPEPYSDAEEEAIRCGLKKSPLTEERNFYFGLTLETRYGVQKVIPFRPPARQSLIEYDITSLIDSAIMPEKTRIGILSSLPVMGEDVSDYMAQMMTMQGQQPKSPWLFVEVLRKRFEVTRIDTDAERIEDIDLLLVIHPKDLAARTLFAIDQFILKGGRTILCIDPHCLVDRPAHTPGQMKPESQSSDMPRLLRTWGLTMDANTFAGDRSLLLEATVKQDQKSEPLMGFMSLKPPCLAPDNAITADLDRVRVLFAGVLKEVVPKGTTESKPPAIQRTPLVMTTDRGNSWKVASPYELMFPDPAVLMSHFVDGTRPVAMGYLITGHLKSSFPDGIESEAVTHTQASPEAPGEAMESSRTMRMDATLKDAQDDCAVVVFADVDFISDMLAFQKSTFGNVMVGDNCNLLSNTVTGLLGSNDLIPMLAGATRHLKRTFVSEIRYRMETRYEVQLKATSDRLGITARVEALNKELENLSKTAPEQDSQVKIDAGSESKKAQLQKAIQEAQGPLRRLKYERYQNQQRLQKLAADLRPFHIPASLADEVDIRALDSIVLQIDPTGARLRRRGGGTIRIVKEASQEEPKREPIDPPRFVPTPLIQGLDTSQIEHISISAHDATLMFRRRQEEFCALGLNEYPVQKSAIEALFRSCMDITVTECVTRNSDAQERVDLTEANAELVVQFLKADGTVLVSLMTKKIGGHRQGHYVRLMPSGDIYVAKELPNIHADMWHYVDRNLLSMEPREIESVAVVTPQGEQVVLARYDGSQSMEEGSAHEDMTHGDDETGILDTLCTLQCNNVLDAAKASNLSFDYHYIIRMCDSTGYDLKMARKDGQFYIQCSADTNMEPVTMRPDEVASEEELKKKEAKLQVQEKAQKYKQRHKGWIYRIPDKSGRHMAHEYERMFESLNVSEGDSGADGTC